MEGFSTETRTKLEQCGRTGCNTFLLTFLYAFVVRATSTRELFILKCPSLLTMRKTLYARTSFKKYLKSNLKLIPDSRIKVKQSQYGR